MKAVILCAGLGTRLRPITNTIPKVMIPIGGKPLLQHHIEWLVGNGIRDIGINLFYLPEVVVDYFGDGSKFGARIHYSHQKTLSETASGFKNFKDFVGNESCLIVYGDNMFDLSVSDFSDYHKKKGGLATIALKEWENPGSKGIVGLDKEEKILWFREKPQPHEITTNVGNAGIYIVEPEIFSFIPSDRDYDFGKDIFPALLNEGKFIYGYHLQGYHIDIGSPEALVKAREDYKILFPNKAIFIDRDGVLNRKPREHDYVKNFSEFFWNDGAQDLIKEFKTRGFLVIVISNQQGIAKGKVSEKFIEDLHKKMNEDLKTIGTNIDGFYYCPHLESEGCVCRKPSPGLLFKAEYDYKIDMSRSFMIGDSKSDIEVGDRAGCFTIQIETDLIGGRSVLDKIMQRDK
ncbi:MAG: HAD-IIIA family hydrolase [Candidatus Paceibacterota bacterium]